ncbi:MAG: hypothetical protein LBH17_02310 [Oscillospiraceae bacterium]|jgi:hypothetical protein|nr:hypothetical protein [Oscillospiraceae bacterium]
MDEYRDGRYRTAHTPRRRASYAGARGDAREGRRVSKLTIAAAAILIAVAARYVFPNLSAAVGDKLSESFNYRAALAALGEGLSGERAFTEALGEAWTVAFRSTPPEGEPPREPAHIENTPEPDVTPDISAELPELPELSDAALSAFMAASRDYADYMMPAGTPYAI